ncbi:carbonic anhydrase 9-like [Cochliomyia hominivorax]
MIKLFYLVLILFLGSEMKASPHPQYSAESRKCLGKHKIPLRNFTNYHVGAKLFEPIIFENFNVLPYETAVDNTGYTIVISMKYNNSLVPTINFGPSSGLDTHRFAYLYFQWFDNSTAKIPIELHAVFYNIKNSGMEMASHRKNNIVVFAFGLEFVASKETKLKELQENLKNVRTEFSIMIFENLPLSAWLPDQMAEYLIYEGAFTFINCNTKILYADFITTIPVQPELIEELELLNGYGGGKLMENYRKFQPPTGRLLTNYEELPMKDGKMGGIAFVDAYYDDEDDGEQQVVRVSSATILKIYRYIELFSGFILFYLI